MSDSITILHAADLHLDSVFDSLPEEKATIRRGELRHIPDEIVALAKSRNADIMLLSGDIFDSNEPYRESTDLLFRALGSMDIPVFIAPGNHDFYNILSPYAKCDIPDNVRIFTGGMECVALPDLKTRVWGAGFTSEHSPSLLENFHIERGDGFMNIAVIHGDAASPASPYGAVTLQQIAESGLDYIALGHNHTFSGLKRAGSTYYAWPGCCSGRGFDETGDKGVCLVSLSPDGCSLEFVPLGGRKYEILSVDVTGTDIMSAVEAAVPPDSKDDIYRIVLTGEAITPPEPEKIMKSVADRFFYLQLRDNTVAKRDIWADCGKDTLKGLFISSLRKMLDNAEDDDSRRKIELAAKFGLAALENGEAPSQPRK